MKVLAILSGRYKGILHALTILPQEDMEYRVLVVDRSSRTIKQGYYMRLESIAKTLWAIGKLYATQSVVRAVRDFQPDIVFTNIAGSKARPYLKDIWPLGIPVVIRIGGHLFEEKKLGEEARGNSPITQLRSYAIDLLYRGPKNTVERASRIAVVTPDMANRMASHTGRPLSDFPIVPVTCAVGKFDLPKAPAANNILTITNLSFQPKLQALQNFLTAFEGYANVRIIAPGKFQPQLKAMCPYPVLGYTSDIVKEYQNASVFCYFSYLDGCPNVVLEAWASHTPVVANRCVWSEELIKHGETGMLVNTPQEAKDTIALLWADPTARKQLVDNAYRYVCNNHTTAIAGRKLAEVFRGVGGCKAKKEGGNA